MPGAESTVIGFAAAACLFALFCTWSASQEEDAVSEQASPPAPPPPETTEVEEREPVMNGA